MNDFCVDNEWQRAKRDRILARFYGKHSSQGRFVFLDKGQLASEIQRRFCVDTIVQGKAGNAICVEEKIVRWPGYRYDAFCLETNSCTLPGLESEGWMKYGRADYLLYCFEQEDGSLECHLIDFPKLRAWFWPKCTEFADFLMRTKNKTAGKLVPIKDVYDSIPCWQFRVAQ